MPAPTEGDIWGDDGPPAALFCRRFYHEKGLDAWDNARVQRVCHKLDCTLEELGAMAGVFRPQIFIFYRRDRWPTHIALVFSMIEDTYDELRLHQHPEPRIPLEYLWLTHES
jgi:hypothetical protein